MDYVTIVSVISAKPHIVVIPIGIYILRWLRVLLLSCHVYSDLLPSTQGPTGKPGLPGMPGADGPPVSF